MRSETREALWAGSAMLVAGALLSRLFPRIEYRPHVLNSDKYVDAEPSGLAAATGVSLDVYALASCMQSEESSVLGHLAVGCAVRNYCLKNQVSPARLLLRSIRRGRVFPSNGHFGSQEAPGKWASTARPPTAVTLLLARKIWEQPESVVDPTGGAIMWDAPEAQDRAHRRDPVTYPKSSADVAAGRIAAGGRVVRVPGVASTRFWKFT